MKAKMNHICGGENLYARALACLLGTVVLLAGCSGSGFLQKKPTAVSLAKTAMEKVQKAESVAVDMDLDATLDINYDQLNIGMKVDLGADVDMEITKNPQITKGSQIIQLEMMGQSQEIRGRFYLDPAGGTDTTYMQWGKGKWMKKTGGTNAESGEEEADSAENPGAGGAGGASGSSGNAENAENEKNGSGSMNVLQSIGLVKAIAEEAMRAELLEEKVAVNDKAAWQIDCTLTGEFLKTLLESYGQSAGTGTGKAGPVDLTAVNWDAVEIPAQICIYEETGLPARIRLNCDTIGKELVTSMAGDSLGNLPIGSLSLDVDDCVIDLTFDRYDAIDPIEIPQEALGAEESENLAPDLTGLLGW